MGISKTQYEDLNRSIFYVTGASSLIWCFAWQFLVYDTPSKHPRISGTHRQLIPDNKFGVNCFLSEEERKFISDSLDHSDDTKMPKGPCTCYDIRKLFRIFSFTEPTLTWVGQSSMRTIPLMSTDMCIISFQWQTDASVGGLSAEIQPTTWYFGRNRHFRPLSAILAGIMPGCIFGQSTNFRPKMPNFCGRQYSAIFLRAELRCRTTRKKLYF